MRIVRLSKFSDKPKRTTAKKNRTLFAATTRTGLPSCYAMRLAAVNDIIDRFLGVHEWCVNGRGLLIRAMAIIISGIAKFPTSDAEVTARYDISRGRSCTHRRHHCFIHARRYMSMLFSNIMHRSDFHDNAHNNNIYILLRPRDIEQWRRKCIMTFE